MKILKDLEFEDFTCIIPSSTIERVLGKRELKHFWKFMAGQTMMKLEEQTGIFSVDLWSFLRYRKQGLKGKDMPLDD